MTTDALPPHTMLASDGTEQRERTPAALAPHYFSVDELPFETLVAMSAGLGAQLRFLAAAEPPPRRQRLDAAPHVELAQPQELSFEVLMAESAGLLWPPEVEARVSPAGVREAGTWGELFNTDEAVLLARIVAVDLGALQTAFLRGLYAEPVERVAQQIVLMAEGVNSWFRSLRVIKQPAATAVAERIQQFIDQQLGAELRSVFDTHGEERWEGRAINAARSRLDDSWLKASPLRRVADPVTGNRPPREQLRGRFFSFLSAISRLQQLARAQLKVSLVSERHEPAVGLLMAFLQLYGNAQQRINRFSEQLTDFYYQRCLRVEPQGALPDQVHLACQRDVRAVREPFIASGTGFGAGKGEDGQLIEFRTEDDLELSDAQVAALCTLRLERDGLISPEREFYYVTRAKVNRPALLLLSPDAGGSQPHWPLFGGTGTGASIASGAAAAEDAQLGLAIASPLLWLKEGQREIRLTLHFDSVDGSDADSLAAVLQADTREDFCARLGTLFGRWLLGDSDSLSDNDLAQLRAVAKRLLGPEAARGQPDEDPMHAGDPLCLVRGDDRPERDIIYDQVFDGLFGVSLSTEAGWWDATEAYVVRPEPGDDGDRSGVQLVVRLRPEDPAIVGCHAPVHGEGFGTALPLLRLRVLGQSCLYPYSLLETMVLQEVSITVAVQGARDLVLHNNLGRLDASKSFNPFGPLPTTASYLVFGSPEMARKNLVALSLRIQWSELPLVDGGFGIYYAGYDTVDGVGNSAGDGRPYDNGVFTASLSVLRDGHWQPPATSNVAGQGLFGTEPISGRVSPERVIEVDPAMLRNHFRPSADAFQFDLAARNGFFKLQLSGPAGAFGHQAYPQLLTRVVSANARFNRKRQLPMPNPPYTPVIERISCDYEARSVIHLRSEVRAVPGESATDVERVLHLHPFGIEEIHPAASDRPHAVLPSCGHDGNLCIGLSAGVPPQGALTLLFHLRDESAVQQTGAAPPVAWSYLADNRWQRMAPSCVLSDTTAGFLTSGIVTLDVPAGITSDNTIMPGGLYWLRVGTERGFDAFAGLYGVQAQALRAARVMTLPVPGKPAAEARALSSGSVKEPLANVPGLSGVAQIGRSFGLRQAETPQQMRTRTGERLQHKNRASTPWDVERLVLANFPGVFKVKCFSQSPDADTPGEVLVVVVPATRRNEPQDSTLGPRVNAVELMRIGEFLQLASSPFARIRVRNVAYERIQVRCNVALVRGTHVGLAMQRLNQAVIEYISPWHDGGYQARFDWTVRCEDIEACIRAAPEVESVTQLSLLHIAEDDSGVYTLGDTARVVPAPANGKVTTRSTAAADATLMAAAGHVHARSPWSLALPMRQHLLAVDQAAAALQAQALAQATGISKLAIGGTFIIGG